MTTPPALTVSRENIKVRKLFEVPSYIVCVCVCVRARVRVRVCVCGFSSFILKQIVIGS
jgi:hypothetical protein